jgi:Protein of unknown function (DUF3500)
MDGDGAEPALAMLEAANQFLRALHSPQKDRASGSEYALFPFVHANREDFDYYAPSSRFFRGIPLRCLNTEQREKADALVAASLSEEGFSRIRGITQLEHVLRYRERDNVILIRDPSAYFISIFGDPGPDGTLPPGQAWGWRYEGHHISLHWTLRDNRIISATPQFIGCQPSQIVESDLEDDAVRLAAPDLKVGTRLLSREEDLARDFIEALSREQVAMARVQVPWDLETTNTPDHVWVRRPHRLEDEGGGRRGVPYTMLSETQKARLRCLVQQYTTVHLPCVQKDRMDRLDAVGWDSVKFLMMNGHERGDALYYRIRGSTFVVEYLNKAFSLATATVDHQHCVWRDNTNDWGRARLSGGAA